MRRGRVVTVAAPGDFGKPRPAVIIQADTINQAGPESFVLALITSTLRDAPLLRLTLEPSASNGLRKRSQIMVDKILTVREDRIRGAMGQLTDREILELNRLLAVVIGLA